MNVSAVRDLEVGLLSSSPWCAIGRSLHLPALPHLAPPRFSPAEQLREPGGARTRLVKDILRTGRWNVGTNPDGSPRYWVVSRETLGQLADAFRRATSRGVAVNLVWGHGDPHTRLVDPRNVIAPLDQVFPVGETLWATVYVDPATALLLRRPGKLVSVRVADDWRDGQGYRYPLMLLHVALVDQPVVPGQGPFRDLALPAASAASPRRPPVRKPPRLSPRSSIRSLPRFSGAPFMPITLEPTVAAFNRLLDPAGLALPDSVTADNFDDVLAMVMNLYDQQTADTSPADPGAVVTPTDLDNSHAGSESRDLQQTLLDLAGQVRDLSSQVATLRTAGAQQAFTARLRTLAATGQINARTVSSLTQTGEAHGWDLSLLAPFEDLQMIDMQRKAKPHASSRPPVPGDLSDLTPKQIAAAATLIGGKSPTSSGTHSTD